MSLPQTNENTLAKRALHVLIIIVVLAFGACIFYLGYVQLGLGEEYRAKAEANQLRDSEISAERGVVYDRNGKELAKSASAWKIVIYPNKMADCKPAREIVIKKLSSVLKISEDTVRAKAEMSQYGNMVVKYRVEKDVREKMLEVLKQECYEDTNEKGQKVKYKFADFVGIENDVKRYYPYNSFASTVLGFTGTDDVGTGGLELQYNSILTGTPGRKITAVSGSGDSMPSEYETVVDAVQGTSLVTTLDETIQRYLEEGLDQSIKDTQAEYAYGIIMDVNTGAILAMSSKPDYDLNNPYEITSQTVRDHLDEITDERKRDEAETTAWFNQWKNRTISDTYEPGSVFKIITAAAALEENIWDLSKTYVCGGAIQVDDRRMHCSHREGHGTQTFSQAFANSCNPFFIQLGLDMGVDNFYKYFEAFGFTERTGIDLPSEQLGMYHSAESMKKTKVQLASSAFGQSFTVTPIQTITAVSAIANGGKLLKPYIVAKTLDPDGNIISETQPTVKRQVISENTAQIITGMMEDVVSTGTGQNAYVAGYRVAGKTGTSEILEEPGEYVASFACFAPADDPQIAMLIAVKKPVGEYYGSQIAAPVAADIMQKVMVYLNVEPKYTEEENAHVDRNADNVVGKSVEEAKQTLTNSGFNVRVIGSGETVVEQVPSSNQTISANGTVILYTEQNAEKQVTTVPDLTGMTVNQVYAAANQAGVNVSIVGNAASSSFISYKQDKEVNSKVYCGDTIVVYFKSTSSDAE
ncbi:MAG: PASTA domain-containing protein [Ruminococcaceae bacterium]|nr:PASTA domain-containing protein [Oscillospiraceae bacterium]